jgi:type I restriction enzyme S subunit
MKQQALELYKEESKKGLPTGWPLERKSLGELCQIKGGKRLPQGGVFAPHPTPYPYIRVVDFSSGGVKLDDLKYIDKQTSHIISRYIISKEDVYLSIAGTIGLVGGIPDVLDGANLTENAARLVIRDKQILCKDFLALYLQSPLGQWSIRLRTNQVGQPKLALERIATIEIPLPSLPEQTRITAILTEQMAAVERARAATEAQLEAAKALPAAYLRDVFDSVEALRWERKPLGELAILGPDNGIFKQRHHFGRGVPIVNVSDLFRSLAVDLTKTERVDVSEAEIIRYGIAPGDLFFCRSSVKREGIGWCCYVNKVSEPAVFECHVMRVRLDSNKANPQYVAYYWSHPSVREQIIGNSRTATMTTMNQADLAEVEIPIPPILEQQRIASILNKKMEELERLHQILITRLNTINALPAVLLRRAFNGEL